MNQTQNTFQSRIPNLSDTELFEYVNNFKLYKQEAVELATREINTRGLQIQANKIQEIENHFHNKENKQFQTNIANVARLRKASLFTLLAGITTSIFIFIFNTTPSPDLYLSPDSLISDPMDSKKYLRDLEMYGGKINILAVEFNRWFNSLWHGRKLSFTIATMTLLISALLWIIARALSNHTRQTENDQTSV